MDKPELVKLLIELCSQTSEAEWLEFKKNNIDPEEIGEYISALSNSACLHDKVAAYLIFGVENKTHEIIGTTFQPTQFKVGNEDFESWLARLLNPRADFKIFKFNVDEKNVVMFVIDPAHNRPIAFKNTAFIRVGSYKKRLLDYPDKERKIWRKFHQPSFEDDMAKSECSGEDVLQLLNYQKYFELFDISLPLNKAAILEKFIEEGFITKIKADNYQINNLGAILFANHLSDFKLLKRKILRVIIYRDDDRLNTLKEWQSDKGYAVGFVQSTEYIADQLPQNEVIEKAIRRQVKMYPDLAIRELVANLLIHQDFQQTGVGPVIEIFKSRIEITNPGKPLINTLRFIDHNPRSRNEQLASFFRRVDFCEERGSGIDKVISSVELFQLPAPNFIAEDDYLRVIIYGHQLLNRMGKKDKIRACYQHCCLKYVNGEPATNKSLRDRFEVSEKNYSIVSRIIAEAIDEGLIKAYNPENKSRKHASYIPFWAF
jgi:ATP-dependent DNA helicase RecG